MKIDSDALDEAGWAFDSDDAADLVSALSAFLAAQPRPPDVLALGEPTHAGFSAARNQFFMALVERGFRSIAIESDAVAALTVNAYVRDRGDDLDMTMSHGFSHGFGRLAANRELVAWMRGHNDSQPPEESLAFYGFDAPLEMTHAPTPRPYLEKLHGYLTSTLGPEAVGHRGEILDRLLGEDERWSNPAAQMDAAESIGASREATALRAVVDDLLTALNAYAPNLVRRSSLDDWHDARLHGQAALGLLRYHAEAAHRAAAAERASRLLGIRDALMAENLLAIRVREKHRGPTLVFAHNRHLQRHPSTWRLGDMDLHWSSAGSILAVLLCERYAFIAGSLGASAELAVATPPSGTFEDALQQATRGRGGLFDASRLRGVEGLRELSSRDDAGPNRGYLPLDAATIDNCDGVVYLTSAADRNPIQPASASIEDLTGQICSLTDVVYVEATEEIGAPESNWGNRFFSVGSDQNRPFATIVLRDMPGFDEDSDLDRPGVFRLNLDLGREEFEKKFGYSPRELAGHRAGIDFAQVDRLLPHPLYGPQGWACILNPAAHRHDIDMLIRHAHQRALRSASRREQRHNR